MTAVATRNSTRGTPSTTIWAIHALGLYLVGKMFYVFGGGTLQPADALLGILAIFMTPPAMFQRIWREHKIFIFFIIWVVIVNVGWALARGRAGFLISASYYVFNLLIVACAYATRNRSPKIFDKYIANWILLSIGIQFLLLFAHSGAARSFGTFSNPNQLSYWTVCVMSILLLVRGNRARVIDIPFQFMALWCQISSASRAGLAASVMLIVIWGFFALETPMKKLAGLMGMALLAIVAVATPLASNYIAKSEQLAVVQERLDKGDEGSQLEIRNYNRIAEYYEYTVLGAGEGDLDRFRQSYGANLEIHSSIGTVFFSYGVIGLTLFILFLGNLAFRAKLAMGIYLIPALVYGLTHQGLRFSFFWLLIGCLMNVAARQLQASAPATPVPVPEGRLGKRIPIEERGSDFLRRIAATRIHSRHDQASLGNNPP